MTSFFQFHKARSSRFAQVRSDGTGLSRVEKDGTGISRGEQNGTGLTKVIKDGTGITKLSTILFCAFSLLLSNSLFARDLVDGNMNIRVQNDNVVVTWFNEGQLYVGKANLNDNFSLVGLSRVPLESGQFNLDVLNGLGNGTGAKKTGLGNGTGAKKTGLGNGTGAKTTGLGNGTGSNVTGLGNGTGISMTGLGNGTGSNVTGLGNGTGGSITGLGNGTGSRTSGLGNGTGTPAVSGGSTFSFAVEVAVGCFDTQAIVYETGSFSEVGYYAAHRPSSVNMADNCRSLAQADIGQRADKRHF